MRGAVHDEDCTIGLELAKNVFQREGVGAGGGSRCDGGRVAPRS